MSWPTKRWVTTKGSSTGGWYSCMRACARSCRIHTRFARNIICLLWPSWKSPNPTLGNSSTDRTTRTDDKGIDTAVGANARSATPSWSQCLQTKPSQLMLDTGRKVSLIIPQGTATYVVQIAQNAILDSRLFVRTVPEVGHLTFPEWAATSTPRT